ncbi:MAG: phosphatase PAP2 family protein [Pseudonocardia sp.]
MDRARITGVVVAWAAAVACCIARPRMAPLDLATAAWLTAHQGAWSALAEFVSDATPSLGGGAAMLALAAGVTLRLRQAEPLVLATGAVILAGIVVAVGKLALPQGGDVVAGLSEARYPSGPITIAVVVGGTGILVLTGLLTPNLRRSATVVVCAVVAAIGAAEIYLGQHRLSDVAASVLLGVALLASVALVARTGLRSPRRKVSAGRDADAGPVPGAPAASGCRTAK